MIVVIILHGGCFDIFPSQYERLDKICLAYVVETLFLLKRILRVVSKGLGNVKEV